MYACVQYYKIMKIKFKRKFKIQNIKLSKISHLTVYIYMYIYMYVYLNMNGPGCHVNHRVTLTRVTNFSPHIIICSNKIEQSMVTKS